MLTYWFDCKVHVDFEDNTEFEKLSSKYVEDDKPGRADSIFLNVSDKLLPLVRLIGRNTFMNSHYGRLVFNLIFNCGRGPMQAFLNSRLKSLTVNIVHHFRTVLSATAPSP